MTKESDVAHLPLTPQDEVPIEAPRETPRPNATFPRRGLSLL
jgi:hypothetical protein